MKNRFCLAALLFCLAAPAFPAAAQSQPATVYTIVPGDTLWGLSKRFLNDPYYWPNLWAANNTIGNPHFIYPGQRVKVYEGRLEIEEAPAAQPPVQQEVSAPATAPVPVPVPPAEEPVTFTVSGSEGFIMECQMPPAGRIVSSPHDRTILGHDDVVYTDIGRSNGCNVGDRFTIYKKMGAISHPVSNVILGDRVVPLGELQLSEVEENTSRAIITKSYLEASPGAFLLPYRERKATTVPLKAADRDLTGYLVDSQTGNSVLAARDLVYVDLGSNQGLQAGNLLYVVREPVADQRNSATRVGRLPVEVVGAVVVLETGFNTSTGVIVKSVDTIYRGDRVELKKSR